MTQTQISSASSRPPEAVFSYVNIPDELEQLHKIGLLTPLLKDKTTKRNIIWASGQYEELGTKYAANHTITASMITGKNKGTITARAFKSVEEQKVRTRKKAEVFTPIWVVKKMNNMLFEENRSTLENWERFVCSTFLEITCGEGPFLATRYDTETGAIISLDERVGLLDAKLRQVNEHTVDEPEWITWTLRAFENTYGYEYQGDSLLIARVNMVMTFVEYFEARWGRRPDLVLLRKVANIVVWNVWQMDGLKGKTPGDDGIECRIYDWDEGRSQGWSELGGE